MTKRQRTLLFLVLSVLFLFFAPVVVLYSQGYRFDFESGKITQTGGIYVKTTPNGVDVFVDNTFIKHTNFVFPSVLVDNLFPEEYTVRIEKDGYTSWTKKFKVAAKSVTTAKDIILFPAKTDFRTLQSPVQSFWPSPQGNILVFQKTTPQKTWELYSLNIQSNEQKLIASQGKEKIELNGIIWSQDGTRILLKTTEKETPKYAVYNLGENGTCSNAPCNLAFLGKETNEVQFSPVQDSLIVSKAGNGSSVLTAVTYPSGESNSLETRTIAFLVQDQYIFWLDVDGIVWRKNLTSNSSAVKLNIAPFPIKQETKYALFVANKTVFLQETNSLYVLSDIEKAFSILSDSFSGLLVSPDKRKVAMYDNAEIWIYFLEDEKDQPQRKTGDKIFLTRYAEPIQNVSWISSHYLLFSAGDVIKAMEIDDRDKVNIAPIGTIPNPRIFLDPREKSLYILSQDKLMISEKLIR